MTRASSVLRKAVIHVLRQILLLTSHTIIALSLTSYVMVHTVLDEAMIQCACRYGTTFTAQGLSVLHQ